MLLNNRGGYITGNPGVHYSFTNAVTTDMTQRNNRSNWNKTGRLRNYHCGDANVSGLTNRASQPAGNTHPVAYVLAQKPGRIASRKICFLSLDGDAESTIGSLINGINCQVSIDADAAGTLITIALIDGTTAIVIDADAVGSLVMAGSGSATIPIDTSGTILGNLYGAGTAPIEIGAVVVTSAIGWLVGNGPVTLDGTLESYGIGWMEGSTEDKSTLTAASIAAAVWSSLAAAFDDAGTMGKKLNEAGSAGDPWGTALPGTYAEGTAGKLMYDLIKLTGHNVTKVGNIITIYEADGETIWRQYDLSDGGRVIQ